MVPPSQADAESAASDKKELLTVSFNQDATSLAVGHDEGYALYALRSLERLDQEHESTSPQRVYVVKRLFLSSLITLVSMDQSRKLSVYHYQKNNEICCHGYSSAVLSVRLNRKRVIVCLEESIHVHNIMDMRSLHTTKKCVSALSYWRVLAVKDTPTNSQGLVDLSPDESHCYLAYPGSSVAGHVHVFDATTLTATVGFAAHDSPLAALQFSPDGLKLATASQRGTVIRVFDVHSGARLHEFSRGMKRVSIHSLAFSADSTLLASSSNTETIHVFSLLRPEPPVEAQRSAESSEGISSWVNYFSQQATAYLPTSMNELMLREKSACTARLPMSGTQTAVALPKIGDRHYLAAATSDGYLFIYSLESNGGECALVRQFRIGTSYGDEHPGDAVPLGTISYQRASDSQSASAEDSPPTAAARTQAPTASAPYQTAEASPPVARGATRKSQSDSSGSTPPDRVRRSSASQPLFASSPPVSSTLGGGNATARRSRPLEAFTDNSDSAGDDDDAIGAPAVLDEFPPLSGL